MAKKNTQTPSADYQVGYGKPPRHTQFKPGQSGHPGRKKGSRNVKSIVADVLNKEVDVLEDGRKRQVTLTEAVVLRLSQQALSGDFRSIDKVIALAERYSDVGNMFEELPEEDAEILARARHRMARVAAKLND